MCKKEPAARSLDIKKVNRKWTERIVIDFF